jgi:hypothetical protein
VRTPGTILSDSLACASHAALHVDKLRELARTNKELESKDAERKKRLEGALRDQRRLVVEVRPKDSFKSQKCRQILPDAE